MTVKNRPYTCPACAARLTIPQDANGHFSADTWQCSSMLCGKVWTADQVDEHRKAEMQKAKKVRL